MSIFGRIRDRIFGQKAQATEEVKAAGSDAYVESAEAISVPSAVPSTTHVPEPTPQQSVDVSAILSEKALSNPQRLNWQTSIVDLMKLLDLDSSLENRRELARELNYQGDTNDSAAMNIWLHQQVMQKLQENSGRVPDALR
jgi:hypothetical protein